MQLFVLSCLLFVTSSYIIPESSQEDKEAIYGDISQHLIGVKIKYFPEEKRYGIVATRDIRRYEPIAMFPINIGIISFDQFPWYSYLYPLGDFTIIAGRLIYEKFINQYRHWGNIYVYTYPSEIDNLHNWTAAEHEYLLNIFQKKAEINFPLDYESGHADFVKALERIPSLKKDCPHCFTKEVWNWAYAITISHATEINKKQWKKIKEYPAQVGDENISGLCILPIVEMIKQESLPLKYRSASEPVGISFQGFPPAGVLSADRNIKAHTEVIWSRGPRRNFNMAIGFGFVLDKNLDDCVMAELPRIDYCPMKAQADSTACGFFAYYNNFNEDLFNYALKVQGVELDHFVSDLDEYFDSLDTNEEVAAYYGALIKYRDSVMTSVEKCKVPYRSIMRKMERGDYENNRYKMVDKICIGHYSTIFTHKKMTERALLKSLLFELSL
ncbi:unnamed protein product [Blepharisma stoltei]|uniref:Uncharacterized protein n=1 Tax=Blepharisma stoltei TaxID=1481888 RepID=A0AAU9K3D7_9CILI|nr:unnamed protein product [Blepharisma stoltei]